ncbi:uncharacterized protein LOC123332481 [Bubalus bubalis]|uniref:uncharacterized protein LOC123332481 n=1 Tax=Bubalus bubalis TaxID=89462 RepID=UPI001E1B7533|nr:uncharacterized protein LOC123332481 [Bubalus bubalis]
METQEGSQSKAEVIRHKRCRSRDGSPESHKRNGHEEEKARGRPPPAQWRTKEHPNSCRAGLYHRGSSAHTSGRLQDRGARFQSPVWARGHRRCQYNPESRPASPKRPRRSQSPEAAEPLEALTSKLSNQMGALEVVLDELRAPGGAFLPVATDHTEPTASQRAWLTWQLTHAGAALHWALTALDSLLPRTTDLRARRSTRPGRLGLRGAPRLSPPLLWSCKAPRQHLSTLRPRTSSIKDRNPPFWGTVFLRDQTLSPAASQLREMCSCVQKSCVLLGRAF